MPDRPELIELVPLSKGVTMKFADSLTFNAAPELRDHYIAYEALKQAIYRLEKQSNHAHVSDVEAQALLADDQAVPLFVALLDKELSAVTTFFQKEEASLLGQLDAVARDIQSAEDSTWQEEIENAIAESDDSGDEAVSPTMTKRAGRALSHALGIKPKLPKARGLSAHSAQSGDDVAYFADRRGRRSSASESRGDANIWSNPRASHWAVDIRITFKLRLQGLFRELTQLDQYISLNQTGFRKIIKKFDKVTLNNLLQSYMPERVLKAYPFLPSTHDRLNAAIKRVVELYAHVVTRGDNDLALKTLRSQLREFIVYERNTIWREMVGLHSRGHAPHGYVGQPSAPITSELEAGEAKGTGESVGGIDWGRKEVWGGLLGVSVFVVLLTAPVLERPEEQNCLALLALSSVFWALEVIPLFVTSLSIPFWAVVLRVIKVQDNGVDRRATAPEATKYIFSTMFSPTIMLLIGGFTLAAALSKHNIDKTLATRVLAFAGTKPATVLIAYMGVACFASMWISNVAAPVLCYGLISPILRTLPPKTDYSKALIIGIALASNIGGQSSPISSPQNLIALEYMNPPLGWLTWFAIALPVSALSVVGIWVLLCHSYQWDTSLTIHPIRKVKDQFTFKQYFVSGVVVATIVLWCISHQIEGTFGDMGVIALIPVILFYGTGCLRKSDFEAYPWAIVFLAMGGISLGKAVLSSGLLDDVDNVIQSAVRGFDIWPILALSSIVCLIIATFVSHTVASVLLVPVAAQIGEAMEVPHPRLLIMATALICSAGMGLPISGFPNMTAINLEDDIGVPYLKTNDFLRNGIPASVYAVVVVITVGYLLMRLLGL